MHPVVKNAKRKIDGWIGVLTFGGIGLLIVYVWVLIPTITTELVLASLAWMAIPTGAMVAYHKIVLMSSRWKKASDFLEMGEDGGVTAGDALKAVVEFPFFMPMFGFVAWVVGGAFASFGAYWATNYMLVIGDALLLFWGIVAAAAIITIFQFFMWRSIVDPVIGLIVHQRPEILDGELPVLRLPLKRVLLATLIPLIILALYLSEIAGYRQASAALQHRVGKNKAERMDEHLTKIDWTRITTDADYRDQMLEDLRPIEKEPFNFYLVEEREDGYHELISGRPFGELFPPLVLDILRDKSRGPAFSHEFNNFGPEIAVFRNFMSGEGENAREYFVIFGFPWENYSVGLANLVTISVVLTLVVLLLSSGVVIQISRDISYPIARLVDFTEEMGEGKIHADVYFHAHDEVGDLSLSIRRMSGQLGEVLFRVQNAARSLDQATGSIRGASEGIKEGAQLQEEAIDDVASAMSEMDMNIKGIAENVEILSQSAEESSSSIFEMGAAIKKINESVDILNQSIGDVSSSINEMTTALDQVAGNVDSLSQVSHETASSMSQMDASIRQIESTAKETAEWSESVISDAEDGVNSVNRVTQGMHDIASVVHSAQQVIERLGSRVEEIGKIVKVIDDIANQTNLLALNAAIIAAQAGEHGRGFAVVADEIKQLAERTSGSTREIHQLIRGVQNESLQAVGAVEDGARAVEEGVKLTDAANSSLAKILESTRVATDRVKGVVNTTMEQAESSRLVSQAMDKVADMINQISVAAQQQSRGGSLIVKATEEMKAASVQVKRNAEEQLQGSKLITKSIENITDMLYSINQSQQEQKRSSHQVVQLMERIKVVSNESVEGSGRLGEVVSALTVEADTLREEMRRFKWVNGGGGHKNHK